MEREFELLSTPSSGAFLPILPLRVVAPEPPAEEAPPRAPADPAAEMEAALAAARAAAWAEGHAAGVAEGRRAALDEAAAGREARLEATLSAIATALEAEARRPAQEAERASRSLAGLMLSMLDAALPGLLAREAADLALRAADRLRPALEVLPGPVRLLVAPEIAASVAERAADKRIEVVGAASVPAGEARAVWSEGAALPDLATRRAAVRAALAEAGLELEG